MRSLPLSIHGLVTLLCFGSFSASAEEGDWRPLFDGKTLEGWHRQSEPGIHGAGGRWGLTSDGVLYGEQDPPGSGEGGLLLTDETFGEFELEISLKPDWGPDSGIFLRTNEKGEGWQIYVDHHDNGNVGHARLETKAYSAPFRPFSFSRVDPDHPELETQPDARAADWPEGVYEETCSAEAWLEAWKVDDWNRIKIRCIGEGVFPIIEVWVNDLKVCRFNAATTTQPKFDREKAKPQVRPRGSIGLQVHRGNGWPKGARVFWKDIRIRPLD